MPRSVVIALHCDADMLFLLNDYTALAKVLPSKIFEYAATGKPVLAGVEGYSAQFIIDNLANRSVFPACDVRAGMMCLRSLQLGWTDRRTFIETYRRDAIMRGMAGAVMELVPG